MRTAILIARTKAGYTVIGGWDKTEAEVKRKANVIACDPKVWEKDWIEVGYQPRTGTLKVFTKEKATQRCALIAAVNASNFPPPIEPAKVEVPKTATK